MTDLPIIIVGAGGHGLVVADALVAAGRSVLGFVDADPQAAGRSILGLPVLGTDEILRQHGPDAVRLANAIGSVATLGLRRSVYARLRSSGYAFERVVHPSAAVSAWAQVSAGAQIMAGAVVQASASVGENTLVNTGATVDHGCTLEAHVHIAPGVTLSGDVSVGAETHVGAGATVIQGVRIGSRCTVAAGAVVVREVPDGTTVMGVPARARPA